MHTTTWADNRIVYESWQPDESYLTRWKCAQEKYSKQKIHNPYNDEESKKTVNHSGARVRISLARLLLLILGGKKAAEQANQLQSRQWVEIIISKFISFYRGAANGFLG